MTTEGEWECLKRDGEYCLVEYGVVFGTIVSEEKARRIVTAVNCHEELVGLVEQYRGIIDRFDDYDFAKITGGWHYNIKRNTLAKIDAVLEKVKNE